MNISEYRAAAHPFRAYAWPGGYPVFAVTSDGAALCFACLKSERRAILEAIRDNDNTGGWKVEGFDINWEDPSLYCDHCSQRIESAYAEDCVDGEQRRQSRNRYVLDCLRKGIKPDATLMRPDEGYAIPETPEMYRG